MANCNGLYPVVFLNANKIATSLLRANHMLVIEITVFLVCSCDLQNLSIVGVLVDVMLQDDPDAKDPVIAEANE